jgi:iron complex outermembrane recepter protein
LQGCVRGVRPLRYDQRSQELRLESTADEMYRWLLGLFYFDADDTERFQFSVPGIAPVPINDYTATKDETAYAVFSDASRALGERWRANGGLRWSRDKEHVTKLGSGTADPMPSAAGDSWDEISWRLGLEFTPADRLLVYASASTGFKSGGVTTELLPNGEFDGYGPEALLAYEAGVSMTFPGRRSTLRASAFDYDFDDMQVRTIAVLESRVTSVIDNAAVARIRGLDLSATTRIADRLMFSGGLVWLPKREFVEFATASGESLSGNKLSLAPEWSVSASIGYRAPLAAGGELSADIDYSYRSELFFSKENDAIAYQDGFGLLNLALRFDSRSAGWHVFALARNVLDTDHFNQVLIQSAPGYPARYEVGFGWRH